MIYIIGPAKINRSWEHPFYMFSRSLSFILKKHNLENKVLSKIQDIITENDIAIIIQPYYREINCKIIFVNSESLTVRKDVREQIQNGKNISMIWNYHQKNLTLLKKWDKKSFLVAPFYHEFYEEHFKKIDCKKDIDFLFYGRINERRKKILDKLNLKYSVHTIETKDYEALYNLINRSKIVLIINYYENSLEIDFYRLTFLLSNKIFVINEEFQKEEKELFDKFEGKLICSKYDEYYENCEKYISLSQQERDKIAEEVYKIFKKKFYLEKYVPIEEIKKLNDSTTNI